MDGSVTLLQVRQALETPERSDRQSAILSLRDRDQHGTLVALADLLGDADDRIATRAGVALSLFPRDAEQIVGKLVSHLLHNPSEGVRFPCAVMLMGVRTPQVRDAYIQSLDDPSDKVVSVACKALAGAGGTEAVNGIFRLLDHPTWDVRLIACIDLTSRGAADDRVVHTIEDLMRDTERTAAYDDQNRDNFTIPAHLANRNAQPGDPDVAVSYPSVEELLNEARTAATRGRG